jgi:hypothetical protein
VYSVVSLKYKKLYICRNLYHHHNIHYYITSLCNRHLHFLWDSPCTRVTRSHCLAKLSCLGQSSSADFASARIPLMHWQTCWQPRIFMVRVRIGSCTWKPSKHARMYTLEVRRRWSPMRNYIEAKMLISKYVPKCSRWHYFRNFWSSRACFWIFTLVKYTKIFIELQFIHYRF